MQRSQRLRQLRQLQHLARKARDAQARLESRASELGVSKQQLAVLLSSTDGYVLVDGGATLSTAGESDREAARKRSEQREARRTELRAERARQLAAEVATRREIENAARAERKLAELEELRKQLAALGG